jgi:RimJ/RimL family protein N-acetyltransferase
LRPSGSLELNLMLYVPLLQGRYVRLEPLSLAHAEGLLAAAAVGPSIYRWTQVPQSAGEMANYIEKALELRDAGKAAPFATVRVDDGAVIGSTRFFDLDYWAWPAGHQRHGRAYADVGEIGYTWLTKPAIRTGANTEAKLLMLTHAFEAWKMVRICLHTDERNEVSRAAIIRLGARFEGILRSHRMASDFGPRNSARYSIVASDWPRIKQRLMRRLYS